MEPKITICQSYHELADASAAYVTRLAAEATAKRGRFMTAVSGGSLMDILALGFVNSSRRPEVDWSAWHLFLADERCVPATNPESNYGLANRLFLRHIDIPRDQIYVMDETLGPAEAAASYESLLARVFHLGKDQTPTFDLVLLGIGEDGHTASLFPKHPLLKETRRWVAAIWDAPKPPPERITLTLPVINKARHVVFLASGEGKAPIVNRLLGSKNSQPELPAQLVCPLDCEVWWFIDGLAGKSLKNTSRPGEKK